MAFYPSATSDNVSRSKQRPSIIPALPLLPSDAKWKRQSVPNQSQSSQPIASTVSIANSTAETDNIPTKNAENASTPVDIQDSKSQEHDTAIGSASGESIQELHVADNNNTQSPSPNTPIEVESQEPNVTTTELPSRSESRSDQDTPTDYEDVVSNIANRDGDEIDTSSIASASQDAMDEEEDLSRVETIVNANLQVVKPVEEDVPISELGISSMRRSSNTVLTEYTPPPVDSSLEAVSYNVEPAGKLTSLTHRKSEAAPEVLTNGHTANQSIGSRSSRTANGYIPSPHVPFPPIHVHLSRLAYSRQSYDIVLQLNPPDRSLQQSSFHCAHTIFLARSERIAELIPDYESPTQPRVINITPVRSINGHAFEAALRFFYTDEVLTPDALIPKGGFPQKEYKIQNFDYAVSYWFAGLELGLEGIRTRALDILRAIVDWDVAEVVMREVQYLRTAAESVNSTDSFEIFHLAETLAGIVVKMLVERINIHNFTIGPEAQVTTMLSRFAQLETHRLFNNPALSNMVFGSLPAPMSSPASFESEASAILLNMNFSELRMLARGLILEYSDDSLNVLQQVVNEREAKREVIVSNRSIPNQERLANPTAWEAAAWKEMIKDGQLERGRVGFLQPNRNQRHAHENQD